MLAWMDLEMTGLETERHVVVEIATAITDDDLNLIAEGPDLVIAATAEELEQMDAVVLGMHSSSGLLDAVKASTISLGQAKAQTLEFLQVRIPQARTVPLCGNSIGTDRRFLAAYMPEIEQFLHYRSIDVSTVKEICRRWYPETYAQAPEKKKSHRAMDDIRESIAELAYYRATIFKTKAE